MTKVMHVLKILISYGRFLPCQFFSKCKNVFLLEIFLAVLIVYIRVICLTFPFKFSASTLYCIFQCILGQDWDMNFKRRDRVPYADDQLRYKGLFFKWNWKEWHKIFYSLSINCFWHNVVGRIQWPKALYSPDYHIF